MTDNQHTEKASAGKAAYLYNYYMSSIYEYILRASTTEVMQS